MMISGLVLNIVGILVVSLISIFLIPYILSWGNMDKEKNKNLYWKLNLTIVGSLLAIWFMVSFGAGILFSENLDQFEIAGWRN